MARVDPSGIVFAVGDVLTSKRQIIPLGTAWSFHQTTAPTGWTKVTTDNNKALRVISAEGGVSGAAPFTSTLRDPAPLVANGTYSLPTNTDNHFLATSEMSEHTHGFPAVFNAGGSADVQLAAGWIRNFTPVTESSGGGGGHNHPVSGPNVIVNQSLGGINLAVQYIDTIICIFNG